MVKLKQSRALEWVIDEREKTQIVGWFDKLRERILEEFLSIEEEFCGKTPKIIRRAWDRPGGGGGSSAKICGKVFEKVGVNVSTVFGDFKEEFTREIPGAIESKGKFWASGLSLISHMCSPRIPAIHMNTRLICTSKQWFGGGVDLTPMRENKEDTEFFHKGLHEMCNRFDPGYYEKFKKQCDEYFYLPHRNEARGVGGIFYDNLNSGDWNNDFSFTMEVGNAFLSIYPKIIRRHMHEDWTEEERNEQLFRRGRYVEFNLLYDRGTIFGLKTGGDPDAIMTSMPPEVKWA